MKTGLTTIAILLSSTVFAQTPKLPPSDQQPPKLTSAQMKADVLAKVKEFKMDQVGNLGGIRTADNKPVPCTFKVTENAKGTIFYSIETTSGMVLNDFMQTHHTTGKQAFHYEESGETFTKYRTALSKLSIEQYAQDGSSSVSIDKQSAKLSCEFSGNQE